MTLRSRFFLRLTAGLLLLTGLSLIALPATAQERDNSEARSSPNAQVSQTIGTTQIDVTYGRPGVKGRDVFGNLVSYGEVWRAGANEPTVVTFSDPVQIEGQQIDAGTYNLFIRPAESGAWEFIFTTPVRWGTMFDQAEPVVTVEVSPQDAPSQEWLAYRFENLGDGSADLVMHWAETMVPVTIQAVN